MEGVWGAGLREAAFNALIYTVLDKWERSIAVSKAGWEREGGR